MVWEIREYGAVDDGRTVNTAVIQNTIDRCHQAGGGTVLIEGGVYLCGTIFLRSNVTLEIAQGTVLKANPDISDYAENTHHNRYRNEECAQASAAGGCVPPAACAAALPARPR